MRTSCAIPLLVASLCVCAGLAGCQSDEIGVSTTFDPLTRFPATATWAWDDAACLLPEDPRIVDSTGALKLELPGSLLVIGGGIIGLEMATVYDALGVRVSVVELLEQLMPGVDADLLRPLERRIRKRYEAIMTGTKVAAVKPAKSGLSVTFEKGGASETKTYDGVLVAVGINAETGLGSLMSLHFHGAHRHLQRVPAENSFFLLLQEDILAEPLQVVGGRVTLPSGPGLGGAVDEGVLARVSEAL